MTYQCFAATTLSAYSAEKTSLYQIVAQINHNCTQSSEPSNHLPQGILNLMQSIANALQDDNPLHLETLKHFDGICNFFDAGQDNKPDIDDIDPHILRAFAKKITACNKYITSHRSSSLHDLFNAIAQFNQMITLCLEDAVSERLGVVDYVIDYLIDRPMEFVAEHKALSICCAGAALAGALYLYANTGNSNNQPNNNEPPIDNRIAGISLIRGDITQQHFNDANHAAIVNAANPPMLGGAGIDGAIHRAAGPGLRAECANVPFVVPGQRCPVGHAQITQGHNLAPLRIIHTVGPDTRIPEQNLQREQLLRNAYQSSLNLAEQNNIRHIALPSISTGIYGYDINQAVEVAVDAALQHIQQDGTQLNEIRFVTFSEQDFNVYQQILQNRCNQQEQVQVPGGNARLHLFALK